MNSALQTAATDRKLLENVMAFTFRPLVDRMVDKYGWTEEEAIQGVEDTKRFLFLCGSFRQHPLAPSEKIDEVWHNFILFTEDYDAFCRKYFGRFIHHRPRRRDDPNPKINMAKATLEKAKSIFGSLSRNWMYIRTDGSVLDSEESIDCLPSCSHGPPSTNCQNAFPMREDWNSFVSGKPICDSLRPCVGGLNCESH